MNVLMHVHRLQQNSFLMKCVPLGKEFIPCASLQRLHNMSCSSQNLSKYLSLDYPLQINMALRCLNSNVFENKIRLNSFLVAYLKHHFII